MKGTNAPISTPAAGDLQQQKLWEALGRSETARRFQMAFSVATGLPLTLVPVTAPQPAPPPLPAENHRGAFCIDGCMGRHSGKPCMRLLQDAEQKANKAAEAVQFRCPAGLLKVLVPVNIAGKHVGNLIAGPFSLEQLDTAKLSRLTHGLKQFGLEAEVERLQTSWEHSPVITKEKVEAVLTLIAVFADHLTRAGSDLAQAHAASSQSSLLQKVEKYLDECEEETSLKEVAKRVAVSPCHFCKLFKKQTGLTFGEYRVKRRLEKVQRLLLQPDMRISEAAFQAGFESLPYFNRAFRRHIGCSPSEYRARQGLHKPGQ